MRPVLLVARRSAAPRAGEAPAAVAPERRRAERTASGPAPIYISRVNVAGEDLPLPEAGAVLLPRLELPAAAFGGTGSLYLQIPKGMIHR